MIKDKLDVAVNQCIEAAGHEWQPKTQKHLLRVCALTNIMLFYETNLVPDTLIHPIKRLSYMYRFRIVRVFIRLCIGLSVCYGHVSI